MLDRSIGGYIPYLFDEKPILKEQFDGFTYYPNTVSFGLYTNYGSPAIYGGYEYTPAAMNIRSNELLQDKHDEALQMMPVLFGTNGYTVTACDLPYVHYNRTMDRNFMHNYPYVNLFSLEDS